MASSELIATMKNRLLRVSASLLLLSTTQPAWALGDFVIPQAAGLIVGCPLLIALFSSVLTAATRGDKTASASQKQWGRIAFWGTLFNSLWLCLLFVFDPAMWSRSGSWSEAKFINAYLLPTVMLAAFLLWRGWARRAAVVTASCLLVGLGYLLWVIVMW
jgi:hypothetical protein